MLENRPIRRLLQQCRERKGWQRETAESHLLQGKMMSKCRFRQICRYKQQAGPGVEGADAGWVFLGLARFCVIDQMLVPFIEMDKWFSVEVRSIIIFNDLTGHLQHFCQLMLLYHYSHLTSKFCVVFSSESPPITIYSAFFLPLLVQTSSTTAYAPPLWVASSSSF